MAQSSLLLSLSRFFAVAHGAEFNNHAISRTLVLDRDLLGSSVSEIRSSASEIRSKLNEIRRKLKSQITFYSGDHSVSCSEDRGEIFVVETPEVRAARYCIPRPDLHNHLAFRVEHNTKLDLTPS